MNTRREVLAVYVRIIVPSTQLYWRHSRSKRVIGGLNPLLDSFTCICFSFVVSERPPEIAAVFWFYEKRIEVPWRVQENNRIFRAMKISIAPNRFQKLSFLILIIRFSAPPCICFSFVVSERPPVIAAVFWFYEKRIEAPWRVQENNRIVRAMKISIAPNCFQYLSFLILIIRSFICHPYEILKTNLHLIVPHFIRKIRLSLHRKLTDMLLALNVPLQILFLPS